MAEESEALARVKRIQNDTMEMLVGPSDEELALEAVGNRDIDVLRYLVLDCGVSVVDKIKTTFDGNQWILHCAVRTGDLEIVRFLVEECGANAELEGENRRRPLHEAACVGSLPIMQYFVTECGVDVNAQDRSGLTALHVAASSPCTDAVRFLLEEGNADPTLEDAHDQTALASIVMHCSPSPEDDVRTLLEEAMEIANMRKQA